MAHFTDASWRIVPLATPRAQRRCANCNSVRDFVSSDQFRINANGRHLDVWLIYRCAECETTWNRPLFERCSIADIGPELLARFQYNDRDTAWRYAFDVSPMQRVGINVDSRVPFRVDIEPDLAAETIVRVTLSLPWACEVRLDQLVAHTLRVPRSLVKGWCKDGWLTVEGAGSRGARQPVRDGGVFVFSAPKCGAAERNR